MSDFQENAFFEANDNLEERFDDEQDFSPEAEIEYDANGNFFYEDPEVVEYHGFLWEKIGETNKGWYILKNTETGFVIYPQIESVDSYVPDTTTHTEVLSKSGKKVYEIFEI